MIKRICAWITRTGSEYNVAKMTLAEPRRRHDLVGANDSALGSIPDEGTHFHIHQAENGKILRVFKTDNRMTIHGGPSQEKMYIIPEDGNVIEFVTRALVEERIK
jgi:hypothetical protein